MTAKMKRINVGVAAVCVALAAYALFEASTFRHTVVGNDPTGPAFFPRLMAAALILLSAILLGQTFIGPPAAPEPADAEKKRLLPPVAGMAVLFGYALVLEPLGFIVATAILAVAFLLLCGVRKWYVLALYPAAVSLIVYYVFRKLLIVFLPEGIFYF